MSVMSDTLMPEWISKLMATVGPHVVGDDLIHCQVWQHDDEEAWHMEFSPSLYEQDGEVLLRDFHVHVSPILALLEAPDVIADPEGLSITGTYERHPIHIVLRTQPEDDEEVEDFEMGSKKTPETMLPN
jgi:hypothetical protein